MASEEFYDEQLPLLMIHFVILVPWNAVLGNACQLSRLLLLTQINLEINLVQMAQPSGTKCQYATAHTSIIQASKDLWFVCVSLKHGLTALHYMHTGNPRNSNALRMYIFLCVYMYCGSRTGLQTGRIKRDTEVSEGVM
jgi:hypothetical protein